jgi:hypothetical protein
MNLDSLMFRVRTNLEDISSYSSALLEFVLVVTPKRKLNNFRVVKLLRDTNVAVRMIQQCPVFAQLCQLN